VTRARDQCTSYATENTDYLTVGGIGIDLKDRIGGIGIDPKDGIKRGVLLGKASRSKAAYSTRAPLYR